MTRMHIAKITSRIDWECLPHRLEHQKHPITCKFTTLAYWIIRNVDIGHTTRSQGQQTAAAAPIGVAAPSSPRYFTCTMLL